jgi:hypothetical protein
LGNFYVYILTIFKRNKHEILKLYGEFYAIKFCMIKYKNSIVYEGWNSKMPVKVILDTDIGSDIDDAVCLAYLLSNPECQLMGVTTVSGQADKRAMLASALCNVAGKDVPIYPGAEEPLIGRQKQPVAQQARVLGNWKHETKFPRGEAIEFMRRTIRENPGEVVYLQSGLLPMQRCCLKPIRKYRNC